MYWWKLTLISQVIIWLLLSQTHTKMALFYHRKMFSSIIWFQNSSTYSILVTINRVTDWGRIGWIQTLQFFVLHISSRQLKTRVLYVPQRLACFVEQLTFPFPKMCLCWKTLKNYFVLEWKNWPFILKIPEENTYIRRSILIRFVITFSPGGWSKFKWLLTMWNRWNKIL